MFRGVHEPKSVELCRASANLVGVHEPELESDEEK